MHFKLDAGGGNNFDVYLVENSKPNCLNFYFPSIHIQASQPHNAWIHIVYTDSKAPEWRIFIDAANIDSSSSTYPFYTYEQDFYDAPLWTYSLFNKPLRFWKGYAFTISKIVTNKYIPYPDSYIMCECPRFQRYFLISEFLVGFKTFSAFSFRDRPSFCKE